MLTEPHACWPRWGKEPNVKLRPEFCLLSPMIEVVTTRVGTPHMKG